MTNDTRDQLKQAQILIKQGDKSGAIRIIKPILKENKDVAAAWWLLANAVDDPKHQKQALEQVLRIRPGEERAQKMLDDLTPKPKKDDFGFDDPFAALDREDEDDPFAEDPFSEDDLGGDPFADMDGDDPFAGVSGLPVGRGQQSAVASRVQTRTPSKSANNNTLIIAIGAATIVIIVTVVGLIVFNSMSSSRPSSSGFCDVQGSPIVNCVEVQMGQLWSGNITSDQEHYWTFQGQAGQRVRIEANGLDEGSDTVLTLFDPSGAQVMYHDDISYPDNLDSRIEMTLDSSGQYRIVVSMFSTISGRYELFLEQLSSGGNTASTTCSRSQTTCGQIAYGDQVSGELGSNTPHSWTFAGQSGQRVTIRVNGRDGTDTVVILYDGGGNLIELNDDIDLDAGNLNSQIITVLPSDGTYRIEVRTFSGARGEYTLNLSR